MLKLQFVILWGVLSFASTIASPVTWEQLSGPFGGPIESQAIHTDGNHFALFDGALNLSSDNVTTWQTVFESALAFQIGLDDLVYVQGQDGLYFSQTGSAWNKLPDGPYNLDLNRMAIAVDGTLYFVDTANLYVSSDRALTWEVVLKLMIMANFGFLVVTRLFILLMVLPGKGYLTRRQPYRIFILPQITRFLPQWAMMNPARCSPR